MSASFKSILTYDFLYENYLIKNKSLNDISIEIKCSKRVIQKYLRLFDLKKCNFCGKVENLIIDKKGRKYSICKDCAILKSKSGINTERRYKKIIANNIMGIERFPSGIIKNITYDFIYEQHYFLKKSLEKISEEYNLTIKNLKKFLKLYNLKEIIRCNHCNTEDNLMIMENRICKVCKSCWKDSYKNRTFNKGFKSYKRQSINTNGIGIKAQFFFKDLEEFLNNKNIYFDKFIYGFFDLKERQLVKLEKGLSVINIGKRRSSKRLDCYIEINERIIDLEYDEIGHNVLNDFERENLLKNSHTNLEIYRIDEEFILKNKNYKFFIFNEILKVLENKNYYSPFLKNRIADYEIDLMEEKVFFHYKN